MSATTTAPARRGPDILPVRSIPLSATADEPLPAVIAPPKSASAHPDDQARGVAKEITAEELAAAEAARRGTTEQPKVADGPAKPDAAAATTNTEGGEQTGDQTPPEPATGDQGDGTKPPEPPKTAAGEEEFNDGIIIPENLPGWARREITKVRRQARDRVAAAMKTAKNEAGEADWQRVYEANRDEIVAKARDDVAKAEKAAREAQSRAEETQKALDELRGQPKPAEDVRPTRDQFDDPDAYDEALIAWGKRESDRAVAAAKKTQDDAAAATAAEEARKSHEAEINRVNESWNAQRAKAIAKYPDYVEVSEAAPEDGGPTITEAMAAAIVQIDNGADVAYYLGQNTEESLRIANIRNPVRQFIEIGRLAERVAAPPARPSRRARPVEHVETTPNPTETGSEEDMETYAARRNKELRTNSRPFFPPSELH